MLLFFSQNHSYDISTFSDRIYYKKGKSHPNNVFRCLLLVENSLRYKFNMQIILFITCLLKHRIKVKDNKFLMETSKLNTLLDKRLIKSDMKNRKARLL